MDKQRSLIINLLVLVAIGLLVLIYYAPIWWVSLTAPNYPEDAFPDGVRIHFHMNGVFNGCEKIEKEEIVEVEALDCVHEMDTINHYVGMYPIASGGVVEKAFSPFLMTLLGMMLLGFMVTNPKLRLLVLGSGFVLLAVWMSMSWYGKDGLKYQNAEYIAGLVAALDQDTSEDKAVGSSGNAMIERLRASLEASGVKLDAPPEEAEQEQSEKEKNIALLQKTYERDQQRKPQAERETWDGSGSQMMAWHYGKNLGRYFNVQEEIRPMVTKMSIAGDVVFWFVIAAMLILIAGARKTGGLMYWLLIIPPILLPVFFIIEYAGWLWWYGHTLNDMGAFTVKPFMPTVFGDGKVAQFTTHSYPYIGFGYMMLSTVLLLIAANLRYKQLKSGG